MSPGARSPGPYPCVLAANLLVGHHVPVHRSTVLLMQTAGVNASTGWMASVRGKAAYLLETGGFVARVRELCGRLRRYTPTRLPVFAAGRLAYVHVAAPGN